MANRTAWTPGNGQGTAAWGTLINSADMSTLANGASVLSSVAGIVNGGASGFFDQFMSISAQLAIASSAVAAGANLSFWLAALQQDGTTYGDGLLVAGTPAATFTPAWNPIASIPLYASTRTTLVGSVDNIIIPPRTFAFIIQNNSGFALSGTQNVKFITYNQQLNN